jgi:gas vesicle protein
MAEKQKMITTALVGAAIGASLGVLFAPGKGSATRKRIWGNVMRKSADLQDAVLNGQAEVKDAREKFAHKANEMKENIKSKMEDVKSRATS